MPTYQYRCTDCGSDLEVVQKFSDASLTECPTCAGQLRKVFNAVGVVFKGSGFYRNDSRVGGPNSGGSESNGSDSKGSDKGDKSDTGGDKPSKGAESTESGSKPAKVSAESKSDSGSSSNGSGSAKATAGSGSSSSTGSKAAAK